MTGPSPFGWALQVEPDSEMASVVRTPVPAADNASGACRRLPLSLDRLDDRPELHRVVPRQISDLLSRNVDGDGIRVVAVSWLSHENSDALFVGALVGAPTRRALNGSLVVRLTHYVDAPSSR